MTKKKREKKFKILEIPDEIPKIFLKKEENVLLMTFVHSDEFSYKKNTT